MKKPALLACAAILAAASASFAQTPDVPASAVAQAPATAEAPAVTPDTAPSAAPAWSVVPIESSLTFSGKQMQSGFEGVFKSFTAEINFDPMKPETGHVAVTVDLASVDTKDAERDDNIKGKEFFNVAEHPTARFETTAIKAAAEGQYIADGNLTIGAVTAPASLAFTLTVTKDSSNIERADMKGSATLDRSKWNLGTGDWKDPSVIANDVVVNAHVVATRKTDAGGQ